MTEIIHSINNWIKKNEDEIINNLSGLVQINTVNNPPSGREKQGQEYIYDIVSKYIDSSNIDMFDTDEVKNISKHPLFYPEIDGILRKYTNRPNLVAKLPGIGGSRSLVFSGHIDTVSVKEKKWNTFDDPFSGEIKDGKMYGRGVLDMKAGTLSGFYALKCLKDLNIKLKGDVFAESVVDEELGCANGTLACRLRNPNINFAILSEPTNLRIGVESRGGSIWRADVDLDGPGGYSQKLNPINIMSELAILLEKYDQYRNKKIKFQKDYNGEKIFKLSLLLVNAGGKNYIENASYIPKTGYLYFYIPTKSGTSEKELWDDLIGFLEKNVTEYGLLKKGVIDFKRILRFFNGHITDLNNSAIKNIKNAYSTLNIEFQNQAFPFICDAGIFKEASDTEVVIIGPKGDNLHGIDEYVEIDSIFNLIKIMVYTSIEYCC